MKIATSTGTGLTVVDDRVINIVVWNIDKRRLRVSAVYAVACLRIVMASDCRHRQVLRADSTSTSTNRKLRVEDLTPSIRAADSGMVLLVGVPRAFDLAKQFRSLGIQVAIGGFHVSGTVSMLPEGDPTACALEGGVLRLKRYLGETVAKVLRWRRSRSVSNGLRAR